MLNGTRIKSGGDYAAYMVAGEGVGQHWGNGSSRLGLIGEVSLEVLTRLCEGLNPFSGKKLTQRLKADREAGIDFTFSAPKSASIMAFVAGDERITEAFVESARETAAMMENNLLVRVRRFGQVDDRVNPEMVGAFFPHDRTRTIKGQTDPHLHGHLLSVNMTFDRVEEKWKAAKQHFLMKDIPYYQEDFLSRFSNRLAEMGYAIKRSGVSFEIEGVSEKLIRDYSRSTERINTLAEELQATPSQKAKIGPRTRGKKVKHEAEELRKEWQSRLTDAERVELAAIKAQAKGERQTPLEEVRVPDIRKAFQHERDVLTAKRRPVDQVPVKRLAAAVMRDFYGRAKPEQVAFAIRASGLKIKAGMVSKPKPRVSMTDRIRRSIHDKIAASRAVVMEQVQKRTQGMRC